MPDMVMVVRCKECKHRPQKPADYDEDCRNLIFPDNKCPCYCEDDEYYSWYPGDNWFCPKGELR
jgi:hypothetical protein